MEKFYINEPMLYKTEIVYGPFYSQDYLHPKFSRINGCFDVSMIVNIKFCMLKNDPNSGICSQVRFPKNMYRSEQIIPLFRYFYIIIQKAEGGQAENNQKLCLEIFTLVARKDKDEKKKVKIVKEEKTLEEKVKTPRGKLDFSRDHSGRDPSNVKFEEDQERYLGSDGFLGGPIVKNIDQVPRKSKSPFHGRMFSKKYEVPKKSPIPLFDDRLPSLISEGSILVGSKGKLVPISKPYAVGLYLMSTKNGIEWALPYGFKEREIPKLD